MRVPRSAVALLALLAAELAPGIQDENQNGMSDLWEKSFNQGQAFSSLDSNHDPAADPDGDGWTNHEEAIAGTHPFVADSPGRVARFIARGGAGRSTRSGPSCGRASRERSTNSRSRVTSMNGTTMAVRSREPAGHWSSSCPRPLGRAASL